LEAEKCAQGMKLCD